MSFIAKLKIDQEEFTVLHCNFNINQHIDESGKPVSIPVGGLINLVVESTDSAFIYDWMISPTQKKSGTITFYRRDAMSKMKTLSFSDAFCVNYREEYIHLGEIPMQIAFTISARVITMVNSAFTKNWPSQ